MGTSGQPGRIQTVLAEVVWQLHFEEEENIIPNVADDPNNVRQGCIRTSMNQKGKCPSPRY